MWKYRYRREYLPDAELVEACNALGEEGWSLVGSPWWESERGAWGCFFKRTVTTREQIREVFSLSPREASR